MKIVYICSPCRGDYEKNITKAQEYCREAVDMGVLPIAPHVYFTQFLDDTIPEERRTGMEAGKELLKYCHEVWVYGIANPSEGMAAEIELAKTLGIPVRDAADVYAGPLETEPPKLGNVTINIPGFTAMAKSHQHLDRPPVSVELDGSIILDLAKRLRQSPGSDFTIGGEDLE